MWYTGGVALTRRADTLPHKNNLVNVGFIDDAMSLIFVLGLVYQHIPLCHDLIVVAYFFG